VGLSVRFRLSKQDFTLVLIPHVPPISPHKDYLILNEILDFHCDYYNVGVISGFGAVCYRRSMQTFRRNMLPPSSGLKLQGREAEGLYSIWGAKAEGTELKPRHFCPEDGVSMFLRNVVIDLRNHMTPTLNTNTRLSTSTNSPCELHVPPILSHKDYFIFSCCIGHVYLEQKTRIVF
jgi:hypothetical protein